MLVIIATTVAVPKFRSSVWLGPEWMVVANFDRSGVTASIRVRELECKRKVSICDKAGRCDYRNGRYRQA